MRNGVWELYKEDLYEDLDIARDNTNYLITAYKEKDPTDFHLTLRGTLYYFIQYYQTVNHIRGWQGLPYDPEPDTVAPNMQFTRITSSISDGEDLAEKVATFNGYLRELTADVYTLDVNIRIHAVVRKTCDTMLERITKNIVPLLNEMFNARTQAND